MNEIISSILDAENKAEEIVKKANDDAKKLLLESENDAEKIRNSAIYVQKVHASSSIKKANEKAQKEYEKIILEGNKDAEKIVDDARPKMDDVANKILEKILA